MIDQFYSKKLISIFTILSIFTTKLSAEGVLLSCEEMKKVQGHALFFPSLIITGILSILRSQIQKLDEKIKMHFKCDDLILSSEGKRIDDISDEIHSLLQEKQKLNNYNLYFIPKPQ